MPADSRKQQKFIYALRDKYKTKKDTPEKYKWIWDDHYRQVKKEMNLNAYKCFFEVSSDKVFLHEFIPSEESFYGYSGEIYSTKDIISELISMFFDINKNNKYIPNILGKKFKVIPTDSSFSLGFDSSKLKEMYNFLKRKGYSVYMEDSEGLEYLKNEIAYLVSLYKKKKDKDPEFFNREIKQIYNSNKEDAQIIDEIVSSYNLR